MVTIREIAERAGVSTATVSNVLHGKTKRVSAATVERVRKLIEEMGYEQGGRRRADMEGSTRLVAVIIHYHQCFDDSVLSDPFYGMVTGSIEEELRKRGYYMILYASQDMEEIFRMLLMWEVSGVIAVSFSTADCGKLYNLFQKPVVSIDSYGKPNEVSPVPDVGLDDEGGGELMVRHLLELGYETIYMAGADDFGIDHLRWVGAQRARDSVEFAQGKRHLEFLPLGNSPRAREDRYREIIGQIPFRRKTAIFFTSDALAMEAMSFFAEWGVRIPEEIGVAGFDNSPEAVRFSIPRLTTVNQDFREKGRIAVQELVATIEDPDYRPRSHRLAVALVSRNSV